MRHFQGRIGLLKGDLSLLFRLVPANRVCQLSCVTPDGGHRIDSLLLRPLLVVEICADLSVHSCICV
jgi:hypothetical protein